MKAEKNGEWQRCDENDEGLREFLERLRQCDDTTQGESWVERHLRYGDEHRSLPKQMCINDVGDGISLVGGLADGLVLTYEDYESWHRIVDALAQDCRAIGVELRLEIATDDKAHFDRCAKFMKRYAEETNLRVRRGHK